MFSPDRPIESYNNDLLGRASFANAVGEAILNYKNSDSVVLALYGSWGSGKTSLINIVIEHIEEVTKNAENQPIIIKFNPWMFSSQDQLISQFFVQLSSAFGNSNTGELTQTIGSLLKNYSWLFEAVKYIPVPGLDIAGQLLSTSLEKIGNTLIGENKSGDLKAIKQELEKSLKELERKIICIIDDIDRLTKEEIKQIFQLVKAIADFPNVLYLMAFDKEVVATALKDVQENGMNYLEKIVQVPFEIPTIDSIQIEKFLFSKIDEVLIELPQKRFDNQYWGNIYLGGIKYFFGNIRDVNRFINTFRFIYDLIGDYVNPVDLIAITALQVFFPGVYFEIQNNKDVFTGLVSSNSISKDTQIVKAKEIFDGIVGSIDPPFKNAIEELLKIMFPKIQGVYSNSYYSLGYLSSWRTESRICSPDCFDIYFRLSVTNSDIPQKDMLSILASADNENELRKNIIGLNDSGNIIRFLDLLEDYTNEIKIIAIPSLIAALMDLGDNFPEGDTGFLGIDTPMRMLRINHQLCFRLDQQKRYEVLKNAITNTSNSLYTIIHQVGVLDQEQGRYGGNSNHSEDSWTVNSQQLDELEQLARAKIEEWAKDGRLLKHRNLAPILYRWKEWGGEKQVKKFVDEAINTNQGLIDLLTKFRTKVHTQSLSSLVATTSWKFHLEVISDFMNIEEIESRLNMLLSSPEYEQFNDEAKTVIKLFFDTKG